MYTNLSHYADIIAIPFFTLLVIYFYNITNKSRLEYVLYLFSIFGVILDTLFTFYFLTK